MSIRKSAHYKFLREEIDGIPGISCHDHMRPERETVAQSLDLFDILFSSVNWVDLVSAGFPQVPEEGLFGFATIAKPRDLEPLWARVRPWLDHVRECATYTTRMRGIRDLHGFDEELRRDVPPLRAQGTTNADLASPFGDAGQHNVHDAYAADQE